MGAAKAGVTVVVFEEKESQDALHQVLKDSGARGMVFSPATKVNESGSDRESFVHSLMPELKRMYDGDALNLKAYPNLKSIIQTGHNNIRGVIKYKDSMVYANTALTGFSLPQNNTNTSFFECY